MIKQLIALITLSIVTVLTMSHAQHLLEWLIRGHEWISDLLTNVFSGGSAGNTIRGLIALLSIPILISLIPTIIYWIIRRHWFPYFMETVWVVWLIQAGALIIVYKAATGAI